MAVLEPYADRIAVIGQVGHAGPVALATARLHALRGDSDRALADLSRAEDIARRTGAVPTRLWCALVRCQLDEVGPARSEAVRKLASEAEALGMGGLAARASQLS